MRAPPRARRTSGQVAFEFVLVLPFYVLFLLLLVDFGMLMYHYVSVANAVREGARYGAVLCPPAGSCTVDAIKQRTAERSGGVLAVEDVEVTWVSRVAPDSNAGNRGDSVVVRAQRPYNFLFFFIPSAFTPGGASIPVEACADMRLEREDVPRTPGDGC